MGPLALGVRRHCRLKLALAISAGGILSDEVTTAE